MKNFVTSLLMALFFLSSNTFAEENQISNNSTFYNYGILANYSLLYDNGSFSQIPGVPNCCPQFKDGNGYAIFFGGLAEYNFDNFGIGLNLGYGKINGKYIDEEATVLSINNAPANGFFEHNIEYDLSSITFGIAARYYLIDNFSLAIGIGSDLYISSNYKQFERVIAPTGAVTFLDENGNNTGRDVRNEYSGEIPNLIKMRLNSQVGLAYNVNLKDDRSLILRPEVSAGMYFGDLIDGIDRKTGNKIEWKTNFIKFGVSLLFSTQHYVAPKPDYSSKELDVAKQEVEALRQKRIQDSLQRTAAEAQLQRELSQKTEQIRQQRERDSLQQIQLQLEQEKLVAQQAKEREEFNKAIEEENKRTGQICKCYVILYISSTNKTEADQMLSKLNSAGLKDASISIYVEPYLKTKYYRVQSKCFENHLEAFDERAKSHFLLNDIDINPQIICNK